VKTYELKCWAHFFEEVWSGRKTFEIRENDRDFQVPCILRLIEVDPASGNGLGRSLWAQCDYMLKDFGGLQPNYVGLSLKIMAKQE
jgi:ParB family chromosome partitioning protein